jgi:hypothetical protein
MHKTDYVSSRWLTNWYHWIHIWYDLSRRGYLTLVLFVTASIHSRGSRGVYLDGILLMCEATGGKERIQSTPLGDCETKGCVIEDVSIDLDSSPI